MQSLCFHKLIHNTYLSPSNITSHIHCLRHIRGVLSPPPGLTLCSRRSSIQRQSHRIGQLNRFLSIPYVLLNSGISVSNSLPSLPNLCHSVFGALTSFSGPAILPEPHPLSHRGFSKQYRSISKSVCFEKRGGGFCSLRILWKLVLLQYVLC